MYEDRIEQLQKSLGYSFSNISLLKEAISHPSMKHNVKESYVDYERLEFLGDAVLNFIITDHIFHRFKDNDEGLLAKTRSSLVCKETICEVAEKLDLDEYLIMTRGEELSGGRTNQNNVENCMEAIIGAIYLDGGIDKVKGFILKLWEAIISEGRMNIDPKSALQEWSQGLSMSIPSYEVVSKTGQAHSPMFKVMVTIDDLTPEFGVGKSIKEAEKMAAKNMLQNIQVDKDE